MTTTDKRPKRERPKAQGGGTDDRPRDGQTVEQENLLNSAGEASMSGRNSGRASGESRQSEN